jgi:hypothetical protein
MSTHYGSPSLPGVSGTWTHYGNPGHGIRGDQVPGEGGDGPGYLFSGLSMPTDAAKEVRGPITRWPAGVLVVFEDSSFSYTGPTDYALYQLYVDGQASTTDIGYGPGVGRIELGMEAGSTLSGNLQVGSASAEGALDGGSPSGLTGDVNLDAVVPAGQIDGVTGLTGNAVLDNVGAAGGLVGVANHVRASRAVGDLGRQSGMRRPRLNGRTR